MNDKIIIKNGKRVFADRFGGLVFTLAGLSLALFPIMNLVSNFSTNSLNELLLVPFGLFFVWPGIVLLFRVDRMHIDLKEKVLYSSTKFFWSPEKSSKIPLDLFTKVYSITESVRMNKHTEIQHRVYLQSTKNFTGGERGALASPLIELAESGNDSVRLYAYSERKEAVDKGRELAEMLSLPFTER